MCSEALYDTDWDAAARPARHVVQDTRDFHLVGDGQEMADHALFVSLVIIRRYEEQAVCAKLLKFQAPLQHRLRTIGAAACDDRNSARNTLHGKLADCIVLFLCHSRTLSCSSKNYNTIRSGSKMPVDQITQTFKIRVSLLIKGCDESDKGPSQMI